MGPAICFSFQRRSVVFQQWQASEWKLALTSNYILPACQGLWDYRLTGLQSALSFFSLILSFPCFPVFTLSLLSDFSHSVVQLSFSHLSFPLDNNSFSIFNSPYSYHRIFIIIIIIISFPLSLLLYLFLHWLCGCLACLRHAVAICWRVKLVWLERDDSSYREKDIWCVWNIKWSMMKMKSRRRRGL